MRIKQEQVEDFALKSDLKWVELYDGQTGKLVFMADCDDKGAKECADRVNKFLDDYPGSYKAHFKKASNQGRDKIFIVYIDTNGEQLQGNAMAGAGYPFVDLEKEKRLWSLEREIEELKRDRESNSGGDDSFMMLLQGLMAAKGFNPQNSQQMAGTPLTPEELLAKKRNQGNGQPAAQGAPANQNEQIEQCREAVNRLIQQYGMERVTVLMTRLADKAASNPNAINLLEAAL